MIVIGDVHGEYDLLLKLIEKLPHRNLCFVGDLVDRGPDSAKVVEFVKSNNYLCVLGNHDDMMMHSYSEDNKIIEGIIYDTWLYNGASQTLNSYKDSPDMLIQHIQWMRELPCIIWVTQEIVISHSYYLPYHAIQHDVYDITWARYSEHTTKDILNIHGHSITRKPSIADDYINIDTGAHAYGVLSAYDTETKEIYQVMKGL